MTTDTREIRILTLQLDPANPPLKLADWLTDAGAVLDVRPMNDGATIPDDLDGYDAMLVLGGARGVYDDEHAPWLAGVRAVLGRVATGATPVLAIGLGAQLLAAAVGGRVQPLQSGYRIGARLVAKRDETELDPLFGAVPISPDVMECRRDTVTALPRGADVLLASPDGDIEAFRIGTAAWGIQCHIETSAATLRSWLEDPVREVSGDARERSERACGAALDEAEEYMAEVWSRAAQRFVELTRTGVTPTPWGTTAPRLPMAGDGA